MNKLPENTPLTLILEYLEEKSSRHGRRDRAIFALRQELRITDIAEMSVSSVVNLDASIRRYIVGPDGKRFDMCENTQTELRRYLLSRFSIKSLEELTPDQAAAPLFPTQKKPRFSSNTLAQHFSLLDRAIHQHFQSTSEPTRHEMTARYSDIPTSKKKSLLSRFTASLA